MAEGGNITDEYNCQKCSLADTTRMVQCDSCDKWFHFECVSVNSDVANVSWNCDSCNYQQPIVLNHTRSQDNPCQRDINPSPLGQRIVSDAPPANVMVVTQASNPATVAMTTNAGAYIEAPTSTINTHVTSYINNPALATVAALSTTKASAYKEAPTDIAPITSNTNAMGHPTYITLVFSFTE